ncbi:MAG: glycosyltransferase A (GT-A) superfamily protein (DUF2064 family) [Halobacteriales archaeon]|jgi:glycosyltransferase A (GT-A) superfamily protein (DUF2064 family)
MTVLAVLATPPHDGIVLEDLPTTAPVSATEAASLYEAFLKDTFRAVEASGGDLLVNYRAAEDLPEDAGVQDAESDLRDVAADALDDVDGVRFEPQVGSTFAARVGNTITHLIREESDVRTAAALPGTAPLLDRTLVDSAAMKLRTNEVVLGPAGDGRVYYAGFSEPIDFEDAYVAPEIVTLSRRARDASHDVEFVAMLPRVETGADLRELVAIVEARQTGGRAVPEHTAGTIDDLGLRTVADEDGPELVRE